MAVSPLAKDVVESLTNVLSEIGSDTDAENASEMRLALLLILDKWRALIFEGAEEKQAYQKGALDAVDRDEDAVDVRSLTAKTLGEALENAIWGVSPDDSSITVPVANQPNLPSNSSLREIQAGVRVMLGRIDQEAVPAQTAEEIPSDVEELEEITIKVKKPSQSSPSRKTKPKVTSKTPTTQSTRGNRTKVAGRRWTDEEDRVLFNISKDPSFNSHEAKRTEHNRRMAEMRRQNGSQPESDRTLHGIRQRRK